MRFERADIGFESIVHFLETVYNVRQNHINWGCKALDLETKGQKNGSEFPRASILNSPNHLFTNKLHRHRVDSNTHLLGALLSTHKSLVYYVFLLLIALCVLLTLLSATWFGIMPLAIQSSKKAVGQLGQL